jgi:hypothetical protein
MLSSSSIGVLRSPYRTMHHPGQRTACGAATLSRPVDRSDAKLQQAASLQTDGVDVRPPFA